MLKKVNKIKLLITIVASLFIFATNSKVYAQSVDGVNVDTLRPAPGTNAIFNLNFPQVKRKNYWSAGAVIHYGFEPVKRTFTPPGGSTFTDYPLKNRLEADLSFLMGITSWLELGVVVPVVAYQNSDSGDYNVSPAGVGDPGLIAKALLKKGKAWDLGASIELTVPLGYYAFGGDGFFGYTAPSFLPSFLASYKKGRFIFGGNAGVLFRSMTNSAAYSQKFAGTWSVGAAFDIRDFEEFGGIRIGLENNGQVAFGISSLAQLPIEIIGGLKYRTNADIVISAGAGVGLTDALGTPLFRVLAGVYYDKVLHNCPAGPEDFDGFQDDDKCVDLDNDGDGVEDKNDKCPNLAEDFDGFKDEDGCPEYDNDGDGVPDVMDKCPLLEEDKDNFEDDDGCPEEGPGKETVKITDSQLLLSSKIYFDYGKTEIKEISYGILDKVAETLNNNPNVTHVTVEGHTDNEGTKEFNLELSESRAKSVVEYLIGKNVDEKRLTYKGFGFDRPKASNETEEGRAINRRVEFKIEKDGE
ncbi:MAG: OmpA family protein [Deltaproteobacteria bacterium]|nr:OmpA family protein [Deltaproteobacteria bacterium]